MTLPTSKAPRFRKGDFIIISPRGHNWISVSRAQRAQTGNPQRRVWRWERLK